MQCQRKISLCFLSYCWEPTLPINIKFDLVRAGRKVQWQTISTALSNATLVREKVHQTSGEKIPHAQAKQQRDHNRHHQVSKNLKLGQNVLLENQIREDKKGDIFSFKWIGSYTMHVTSERNLHSLINNAGK